jgi:hypothetical protein
VDEDDSGWIWPADEGGGGYNTGAPPTGAADAVSLGFAAHQPHFMNGSPPDRNAGGRTGAG